MQSVLMRRKTELEQMLQNARGTSFENVDTSRVSIGTIVTLREVETDKGGDLHHFRPWDANLTTHYLLPNRHWTGLSVMKSARRFL